VGLFGRLYITTPSQNIVRKSFIVLAAARRELRSAKEHHFYC